MVVPVHHLHTLINTNSPDFDLERDLEVFGAEIGRQAIAEEIEAESVETFEGSERKRLRGGRFVPKKRQFQINIYTIIVSAIIFLTILAWFDFAQTTFYEWVSPKSYDPTLPSSAKFYYAIAVTIFVTIACLLILYYNRGVSFGF